jgi:hypothetical protein
MCLRVYVNRAGWLIHRWRQGHQLFNGAAPRKDAVLRHPDFRPMTKKGRETIMATTTSLLAARFDPSRQIEWCFLFLEHLNEFATLAWHLVEDCKPIEYLIWRALARLEDIPFDTTVPLLTYNQARDMLIAEAIAYLHVAHDQRQEEAAFADQPSDCDLPHLPRVPSHRETALRSSEADLARFFQVSQSLVPELVRHAIGGLGQRLLSPRAVDCYDA